MSRDILWLPHDVLASLDKKIIKAEAKHGLAGYALFFKILELMARDSDHRLPYCPRYLKCALGLSPREAKVAWSVVNDFGLFVVDEEAEEFYNARLIRYFEGKQRPTTAEEPTKEIGKRPYTLSESAIKQRQSAARKNEIERNQNEIDGIENEIPNEIKNEINEKENEIETKSNEIPNENGGTIGGRKEKREKEIDTFSSLRSEKERRRSFSPPTPQEVREYAEQAGYNLVDAEAFCNYYESQGWMVGKNKMQKWKAAVANWHKKQLSYEQSARSHPRSATNPERAHRSSINQESYKEGGWDGIL